MIAKHWENAVQPYESKLATPIQRVKLTPTPYTVKSMGLQTDYYVWTDTSTPDWASKTNLTSLNSGVTPLVGFYFGLRGQPIGYRADERVVIVWTGWFYTKHNADTTNIEFSALGAANGAITVIVNSSTKINAQTFNGRDRLTGITGTSPLLGDWQQIEVRYWSTQPEKGFALFWRDDVDNIWMPMSAGVCNTVPGFTEAITLPYVTNISDVKTKGDITQVLFDIPLVTSDTDTDSGYYFDAATKSYVDIADSTNFLRKHYLIESEVGFKKDQLAYKTQDLNDRWYLLTADFTAEMLMDSDDLMWSEWVKVEPGSTSLSYIFRWKNTPSSEGVRFDFAAGGDNLTFTVRDSSGNQVSDTYDFAYDDGQWHHYAISVQRSSGLLKFCLDGVVVFTMDISTVIGSLHDSGANIFYVGSSSSTSPDNGSSFAEMRYYNFGVNGLTDTIRDSMFYDLYHRPNTEPSIAPSGALQWRLAATDPDEDKSDPDPIDISGNGNDFTGTGDLSIVYDNYSPAGLATADSNYEDYVKLFIGHIKRFEIKRNPDGNDSIQVFCESFEALLKEQLNLNYPDKLDYWMQGFSGKPLSRSEPNSVAYLPTFDAWPIEAAVRALLLRGYIDPVLLYKKRTFLDSSKSEVTGNFLIETPNPVVQLERGKDYGQDSIAVAAEGFDNEYRIKSNFGDKIFDYINQITDQYGWDWGSAGFYDGAFYFKARNNPIHVFTPIVGNPTLDGTWSGDTVVDLSAISGTYRETATADDYIEWTGINGKRIDVVLALNNAAAGSLAYVVSGSAGQVQFRDIEGESLASGHRLIFELPKGNESVVLDTNVSGDDWTFTSDLSIVPPAGTRVRTAVAKAEIVRGSSYAGGELVSTTYLPSYFPIGLSKLLYSYHRIDNIDEIREFIVTGTHRLYYHGFDPETADNPCQFNVGSSLDYEDHVCRITRLENAEASASAIMSINALYVYEEDLMNPVFTFHTGDTLASGTLISLDVKDSGLDQRNDVTVVGQKLGAYVPGDATAGYEPNPNNPTFRHIISRSIDIESIIASGAPNFIGRPVQTILIEPAIGSLERADHWSVNFLNEYRTSTREPVFQSMGHPILEIDDPIYIDDEKKNSIETDTILWINSISHNWNNGKALTTFEASNKKPAASFQGKVPVDTSTHFSGEYISNLTISDNATDSGTPFDPYTIDDEGGEPISITFDLNVDAWVTAEIWGVSDRIGTVRVASLLNNQSDENAKGTRRLVAGKNKVMIWDGVDQYGQWNNAFIPATDKISDYHDFFAAIPVDVNDNQADYAQFFIRIVVKPIDPTLNQVTISTDDTSDYIYTKVGDASTYDFKVIQVGSPFSEFVAGTASTKPTGIQSSSTLEDITGRPIAASIQWEELSNDRPHMVFIDVEHLVFHGNFDPSIYPTGLVPIMTRPNIKLFGILAETTFARYGPNINDNVVFFEPERDLGVNQTDWTGLVGSSNRDNRSMGHYFLFHITMVDKSGRAHSETAIHWWDHSSLVPQQMSANQEYILNDDAETNLGVVWGHRLT